MVTTNDIVSLNRNRAAMYSFFAKIYEIEADESFINTLKTIVSSSTEADEVFSSEFKRIADFINNPCDNFYNELAADYAKVFLGIGEKQSEGAFPFESVYTSTQGLLMQEARDEVLQIYRQNGFVKADSVKVPEDHLYIELQFMAELSNKIADAFANDDNAEYVKLLNVQHDFIKKHFNRWVFRFCSEINDVASTDYYKALADMTAKFIKMDEEMVADLLSQDGDK